MYVQFTSGVCEVEMQIELTDSLRQEAMYIKNDTLQRKGDTLDNKVFSYKHVLTVISI